LAKHQIAIDFNQGLDARFITEENARLLTQCKWATPGGKTVRLALDSLAQIPKIDQALRFLGAAGLPAWKIVVYILLGFEGLESDVERLLFLHRWNASVFPMGYRDLITGEEPARGWDRKLYNKYRRLITRMPHAQSIWDDFKKELS
jgi:hypothetical protein